MDRRQQKTRKAIFSAFQTLLETKRYDRITVQDIIDEADVGRSTFYAHFETKEALLDAFCGDAFFHLFGENACHFTGAGEGLAGKLPHILWHIREDIVHFRTLTSGHPVIMGRKTYDSLGRPLPNRTNVVISRTAEHIEGCQIARSLEEAIALFPAEEYIFLPYR